MVYNIYMMKFKAGDRVRVINEGPYCRRFLNQVHTICDVHPDCLAPYALDIPDEYPIFYAGELEKVECQENTR